jgi:hypothetical protein
MGFIRKVGKKIARGFRKVGRKLKKGLGKIAKAFGKLGPLGTIALSFILPGIGTWISSVAQGSSFLAPIAQGLVNAGSFIKEGVSTIANSVTGAIEKSINLVSRPFSATAKPGSAFRNWASDVTGGYIEPSTISPPSPTDATTKVVEETVEDVVEDVVEDKGKPSVFEGRKEGQSIRDYLSESREYSAYKKVGAVAGLGRGLSAQELAEQENTLYDQKLASDLGLDYLQQSSYQNQSPSLTSQNFIDYNLITTSDTGMTDWMNSIYPTAMQTPGLNDDMLQNIILQAPVYPALGSGFMRS